MATITTDETGVAKLTDLPLGKYYVKEKETASGYVLDGEIREVDLTYRDQNTTVVTYSADWQNKRQRAEVNVLKKEKDSDRVLEGAVFALCNKEDIVNAKGDVILKADAPDGYLVAEDVKFTVKDTGEIQKVVMKDEAKPEETPTETPTETPEITPTPETKTTEETKKSTSPKTGDNTPILFWILLAGGGMAGLGGTVILRKKKK